MATMSKRLAYRMSGQSKGAPRDESTAILVFWKLVGGLVGGLALVLLVMNLLGEISFRRTTKDDAFSGVYHQQPAAEQNQNPVPQQPDDSSRGTQLNK